MPFEIIIDEKWTEPNEVAPYVLYKSEREEQEEK